MREITLDYASIGKRIKAKRLELHMTQEQLGEIVNLSTTHISHIETGHTKISFESFISISNALHISADALLQDNLEYNDLFYKSELAELMRECTPREVKNLTRMVQFCIEMMRME
ncbi:hypothetical protein C807_00330 [Lachnospiraceae bacterium 28-4]|nr:hypothetical protein C807_00330 [Lachnospiraceae bacterium 28-4]